MNNYFVDTHAHIYKEYYDKIDEIVNNAKNNGIKYVVNNGSNAESNKEIIESINNDFFYGAIGIHPEEVENYSLEDIEFIKNNLDNKKIVAIGEIGLDYYYSKDNKEEQIKLFETQLQVAEENNMPVIVHSREATEDIINCLKKFKVRGVIHSFSGSYETAQIYLKMGFILGINGVVTFKNSKLKDTVKRIGLDNIVLETDSPYLTPHPNRGKRNEPKYILDIAKFIAELFEVSLEEVANKTNKNIKELYKIK